MTISFTRRRYLRPKVKSHGNVKRIHPLIPGHWDRDAYVYFLLYRKKIVYIGKSRSLRARLGTHNCYTKYDRVRFIKCDLARLDYYERRWIRRFKPEMNIHLYPVTV